MANYLAAQAAGFPPKKQSKINRERERGTLSLEVRDPRRRSKMINCKA